MNNITYRISDGRYIGRKQIHGNRITVYGNTQKECHDNLKEAINYYIKNGNIDGYKNRSSKKNKLTLIQYFDKWYKNDKAPFITDGTRKDILCVREKLEPLHNIPIEKLNKDTIIKFLKTQKENRPKEKLILYFKACLKSAVLDDVIKINPFNNLKTAPRKHITKPAFTYDEQVEIINNLNKTAIKPMILIYLITGMRKNEFNFSSIEKNIDFKKNILKVRNLKGRNFVVRYKNIKLSKGAISLIMNNLDIIHKYDSERCYREFAEFLKNLGINGSIVTCRHTFATNCFYLGKPQLVISREMGHSSTAITENVYTDIDYNLSKDKIITLYNGLYNLE